jgi:pancreatic triacylglycerol lipase
VAAAAPRCTSLTQATANTQIVGAEVSLLINEVILNHQGNRMLFHIIGHSLGAHAAGYAGSRIKPSI